MFFKFIFILSFRHFHKNIKFFLKIYNLKMEAKIRRNVVTSQRWLLLEIIKTIWRRDENRPYICIIV